MQEPEVPEVQIPPNDLSFKDIAAQNRYEEFFKSRKAHENGMVD